MSKKFVNSKLLGLAYYPSDWLERLFAPSPKPLLRRSEAWGIHEATLQIKEGETVGIIGSIGAGKSTFARILSGEIQPDYGKVTRTVDVLSKYWDVETLLSKCNKIADREKFMLCLLRNLKPGHYLQQGQEANFYDLNETFAKECGVGITPSDLLPSKLSLIIYRYFLENFPGLVVLDDFMSDLQPQYRARMAGQWRNLDHAARARVLVFDDTTYVKSICDRVVVIQGQHIVHDGAVGVGLEKFDAIFRARPDEAKKYYPYVATELGTKNSQPVCIHKAGFLNDGEIVHTAGDEDSLVFFVDIELYQKLDSFQIEIEFLKVGERHLHPIIYHEQNTKSPVMLTKGSYRIVIKLAGESLPFGFLSRIIKFGAGKYSWVHLHSAALRVVRDNPRPILKDVYSLSKPTVYPGFTYESNTEPFAKLPLGSMCIDCGANVGDVTQLMLMHGCRVIAFEPNPTAYAVLSKRFEAVKDVTCIAKGVFDRGTFLELYFPKNSEIDPLKASVSSSIFPDKNNISTDHSANVEVVDIAEVLDSLDESVALMKIDIEGAEYKVLNRLLDTGKISSIGQILVEEHYSKIPSLKVEREQVMEKITANRVGNVSLDWM